MKGPRGNREMRALDRVLNIAYYIGWVVTAILLIGMPAVRLFSADLADRSFTINVPTTVTKLDAPVGLDLNAAPGDYELKNVTADVAIPISAAPTSFLLVTWIAWALTCALTMLMLYNARGLVRRVRAGSPFDLENAMILRRLGQLLLVRYIVKALYVFGVSSWLVSKVSGGSVPLSTGMYANWSVLLTALVLMVLAEIFRRGAALEDEQALVV